MQLALMDALMTYSISLRIIDVIQTDGGNSQ